MEYIPKVEAVRLLDFGAGYGRYLDMFSRYIKKENLYGAEVDEDSCQVLIEQGFHTSQLDKNGYK